MLDTSERRWYDGHNSCDVIASQKGRTRSGLAAIEEDSSSSVSTIRIWRNLAASPIWSGEVWVQIPISWLCFYVGWCAMAAHLFVAQVPNGKSGFDSRQSTKRIFLQLEQVWDITNSWAKQNWLRFGNEPSENGRYGNGAEQSWKLWLRKG